MGVQPVYAWLRLTVWALANTRGWSPPPRPLAAPLTSGSAAVLKRPLGGVGSHGLASTGRAQLARESPAILHPEKDIFRLQSFGSAAGLAPGRAPPAAGPGHRPALYEAARPSAPAPPPSHALPNFATLGIPLRMAFRRRNRGGRTEPQQSAPAGARRGSGPGGDREIWRAPRGARQGRDTAVPEAARKRPSEQLRIIGSPNAVGRRVWR